MRVVAVVLCLVGLVAGLPLTDDTPPPVRDSGGDMQAELIELQRQEKAWLEKLDMMTRPSTRPPAVPEYMHVLYADMENQPALLASDMMALAMWPPSVEVMDHQLRADIHLSAQFYKHKTGLTKAEIMLKRHLHSMENVDMQIELCSGEGRCDFAKNLGMRQFEGEKCVWDVFDVTEVLSVWLFHGKSGEMLTVDLTLNSENRFESIHSVYDITLGQPDMLFVAYVNMIPSFPLPSHGFSFGRKKRSLAPRDTKGSARLQDYIGEGSNERSRRDTMCQLHRWMLKMEDIGWDNWIISPETMIPNVCLGSCAGLSNSQVNRTNHAFLRQMYLTRVEASQLSPPIPAAPECIPLRFAKQTILYYAGGDQIIVKDLPEMVATSCGCL